MAKGDKSERRNPVDPETLPYRPCVGVMVLNAEGLVWVGRRLPDDDSEMTDETYLWQMPQGGIDPGEDPLATAKRELWEETGIESAELVAELPDWIDYDLPPEKVGVVWKGRYRGQTQKWFAFRFHGDEREIRVNPPPGGHKAEFGAWAWRRMEDLPGLVVPFKKDVYLRVVDGFSRLLAG